jgi:tRNA G10  N-methylase Trm11
LAYALVRCAAVKSGDHVVDPFCGSGTLLLEALEMFGRGIKCKGMDVSKRSTDGARENALAEGCGSDVCEFACTDARGLRRYLEDNSVDAMITNLPWGVMTGHKNVSDLQTMYEVFLRTSWYVLKDGARIVMLVLRGLQLTRIVRKLAGRYRLLNVNVVRTTNNLPCIIVIEKLGKDELRESVKGQLSYMSKYVNFSPEIYEAIHMETIDDEH